jgi:hypothetical protein
LGPPTRRKNDAVGEFGERTIPQMPSLALEAAPGGALSSTIP